MHEKVFQWIVHLVVWRVMSPSWDCISVQGALSAERLNWSSRKTCFYCSLLWNASTVANQWLICYLCSMHQISFLFLFTYCMEIGAKPLEFEWINLWSYLLEITEITQIKSPDKRNSMQSVIMYQCCRQVGRIKDLPFVALVWWVSPPSWLKVGW